MSVDTIILLLVFLLLIEVLHYFICTYTNSLDRALVYFDPAEYDIPYIGSFDLCKEAGNMDLSENKSDRYELEQRVDFAIEAMRCRELRSQLKFMSNICCKYGEFIHKLYPSLLILSSAGFIIFESSLIVGAFQLVTFVVGAWLSERNAYKEPYRVGIYYRHSGDIEYLIKALKEEGLAYQGGSKDHEETKRYFEAVENMWDSLYYYYREASYKRVGWEFARWIAPVMFLFLALHILPR